jgi:pantoate--beta-alanine ligase
MNVIEKVSELRTWRRQPCDVFFVPTMGALHEGHATLLREARASTGGRVAVSIFVNPLQFGPKEDFSRYPRTLEADLALCESCGVDMVFAPMADEVYFENRSISIRETSLSRVLCGASRPGHFDGVCTVVAKLFNLVQPDVALFGKKDYQQLAIIRRLVRDLDFAVEIRGSETVRESDGLAMSSRNRYLTKEERSLAPGLRAALLSARAAWNAGETNGAALEALTREEISLRCPLGRVDYVSAVDSHTLAPLAEIQDHGLLALAVFFGKTRLIDNIELHRDESKR